MPPAPPSRSCRRLWRKRPRKGKVKDTPYESGVNPVGDTHQRFNVRFYLVAMIFLVFDVEVLFLIPWLTIFPRGVFDRECVVSAGRRARAEHLDERERPAVPGAQHLDHGDLIAMRIDDGHVVARFDEQRRRAAWAHGPRLVARVGPAEPRRREHRARRGRHRQPASAASAVSASAMSRSASSRLPAASSFLSSLSTVRRL